MITANSVRVLKGECEHKAVFLLPGSCFNYMGPEAEKIDCFVRSRILLCAGQGRTRIVVAVPCINNHTDSWNYDTAKIVCEWYKDNDYDAWVEPLAEQYGDKRYFLVTIAWED